MILDILESEIFSHLARPSYDLNVLNYDFWKLGSETAESERAAQHNILLIVMAQHELKHSSWSSAVQLRLFTRANSPINISIPV